MFLLCYSSSQSKSDLHEIIPALSTKMRNRIFFDDASLEPPIMFIEEKQGWPEDKWEDKENGILNLSMYALISLFLSMLS